MKSDFRNISARTWWLLIGLVVLASVGGVVIHVRAAKPVPIKIDQLNTRLTAYFEAHDSLHGVYFEYLPTHQSLSFNGRKPFLASSLLKVPYVMNLYRARELKRLDLNKQVAITPDMRNNQFGALGASGQNQISLHDAAQLALDKSDNTAINLVKYHSQSFLGENEKATFALNVHPVAEDGVDYIDAISYSRFFHCLYVACYNNRDDSETMLRYMSETGFPGISSGVPRSVRVAHKIGIAPQTHGDCGIVYAPHQPYILCIIINQPRGTYVQTMKEVSAIVYQQIIKGMD